MVIAGVMWLIGFTGSQFPPDKYVGRMWLVLNTGMIAAMVWTAIRWGQRGSLKSSLWGGIFLFWLSLGIFDALIVWLFDVNEGTRIGLLALLTVALGYALMGILFHWLIATVGILIAVFTVGAFFLLPDYFTLTMAILGGGLWMVRSGK
jgi:hypothetical protein